MRRRLAALLVVATMTAGSSATAAPSPDARCHAALRATVPRALATSPNRALRGVDGKCRRAVATRDLFPNADPVTALAAAFGAELTASDAALLREVPITRREIRRCRRAIAAARRVVAQAAAIQDLGGKRTATGGPRLLDRALLRAGSLLGRGCRDVDPDEAGTCMPFPSCVVASARGTGRAMASVAYGAVAGARVQFDLTGDLGVPDRFWNLPFPFDLRLLPDGRPDVTGHPAATGNGLLDLASLRAIADRRPYFPAVPTAYFRFSASLAPQVATTVVPASIESPILLVDVDPASPERGRLFPVVAQTPPVDDSWVPAHFLAVGPMPGTVLPAGRRYAVVVLRALGDASGAPLGVPLEILQLQAGGTPPGTRGEAARALAENVLGTLDGLRVPRSDVAAFAVFTTGDVVRELAALTEALRVRDGAGVQVNDLALDEVHERFCELRGSVRFPQYQRGEPDFDEGGDFEIGADGLPVKLREEEAPVVVSIPRDHEMPGGGFPLVVYFHGSAGLAAQVVDRGPYTADAPDGPPTPGQGPAHVLAAHGIAAVGPAMPLNPERLPHAAHRAYLNPDNLGAYPSTFRQGTIEQRMLLDALGALRIDSGSLGACTGVVLPPGETQVRLATGRVGIMGQSMGAQYANMVSAVDPRVAGVVPTGSGGLWGYVFLEAQVVDIDDQLLAIRPLVPAVIGAREPLSHLHPAFGLLELGWEWAETAVFAARIARDPLPGHPQRHVYLPISDDDPGFPSSVYAAMALATGTQQAGQVLYPPLQSILATAGLGGVLDYPVSQNATSRTGVPYTGVVAEYDRDPVKDGHYIAGQLDEVKRQYGCFFETLLRDGTPVVPPPSGLGTPCPRPPAALRTSAGPARS